MATSGLASLVLTAGDVMPLVLAALPSFRDEWESGPREDNADAESPAGRLSYLDAAAVAQHVLVRHPTLTCDAPLLGARDAVVGGGGALLAGDAPLVRLEE